MREGLEILLKYLISCVNNSVREYSLEYGTNWYIVKLLKTKRRTIRTQFRKG